MCQWSKSSSGRLQGTVDRCFEMFRGNVLQGVGKRISREEGSRLTSFNLPSSASLEGFTVSHTFKHVVRLGSGKKVVFHVGVASSVRRSNCCSNTTTATRRAIIVLKAYLDAKRKAFL